METKAFDGKMTKGAKMETDKIYLGDAYELIKGVPDKSVDLIVTDPPYLLSGKGGGCFGNSQRNYHAEYMSVSSEKAKEDASIQTKLSYHQDRDAIKLRKEISFMSFGFDCSIISEFARVLKCGSMYVWCSRRQLSGILMAMENLGLSTDVLAWVKTNPIPTCGSSYLHDIEYCVFGRGKGAFFGGSYYTKSHFYESVVSKDDKEKFLHPTIKPLEFIKKMIVNSSVEGNTILDPFCGSGTTCVAAKELGRHYIGFEINEKWHRIAVDRINGADANGQISLFADFEELEKNDGQHR